MRCSDSFGMQSSYQGRVKIARRGERVMLALLLMALGALASAEPRTALVIGNGAYGHAPPLVNPLNDARDVAADLKALGFELIGDGPYENTSLDGLIDAVDRFVGRLHARGGVGLLYYSGHGVQVGARNYLVPVDARLKRKSRVKYEAYALEDALSRMGGRGAGSVNLVILDACRDNPFLAMKGAGEKGLARVEAPESMLILYATRPGSTASDNPGGRNGLFTEHLRTALKRPGVDVELAFSEVVKGVYHDSGQEQYPWKEGVLLSRFYFVPPGGAPDSPTAAELEFWRSANACGSDACLQSYLQAYPGGRFTPLAHAKLKHSDEDTTVARETIPFTVKTSPEGAQVRILNIKPKYEAGIALQPGRYRIEVTQPDYEKHLSWFDVTTDNSVYAVELGAVPKPQPPVSQAQAPRRSVREPEMASIRGGCFQMGSPASEKVRDKDERQHQVCVADFGLGEREVTVGEFRDFVTAAGYRTEGERADGCHGWTGKEWDRRREWSWRDPGYAQNANHPVVCVSWNDALAYSEWLSQETGQHYRLPTEAEWEYAARAGTRAARFWGEDQDRACQYANVRDITTKRVYGRSGTHACDDGYAQTAPVGRFRANRYGLSDMLGNVWEWTCSAYDEAYEGGEKSCTGPGDSSRRVVRGGSWHGGPGVVRSAGRTRGPPDYRRTSDLGFRLAQD